MSTNDTDITIPVLTVEQISALGENQLSLDLNWPAGSMDYTYGSALNAGAAAGTCTVDSIDLSGNIDWSKLSINTGGTGASPSVIWTDTIKPSAKITLTGDDADIEINGESVMGVLKEIRDRLGIIQVSEAMEAEWDELKQLREQYEAKLAECREKSRAWNMLKE